MTLRSNTLLRAAIGVVLLPLVLVAGIFLVAEPSGGLPFVPQMALVMLGEAFFLCVLVQVILIRMRKTSRLWCACAYGVPFAVAGWWFSDGNDAGVMALVAVLALTGAVGAILGLAQWMIVVWRNAALLEQGGVRPAD